MYKVNLVNTESSRPACTVEKDCLKKGKEQAIKGTLAFNPSTGGFLNLSQPDLQSNLQDNQYYITI